MVVQRQRRGAAGSNFPLSRLLFLALLFLCGVILGQLFALQVPESTGAELESYLSEFLQLERESSLSGAAVSTLVLYFRYPLLAFLLGFASIGILLLPAVSLAFGFFLSFSVSCFTASFGGDGVLLALAVFGLRCPQVPGYRIRDPGGAGVLPSHQVLRCGCAGLVFQDHPVGVSRILGGCQPGSSAERTADSGTGWMY